MDSKGNYMGEFFDGMRCMMSGLNHLSTKGLKRFVILPVMFNFLLFTGLFYLVYHYLFPYSYTYLDKLPSWLSFLNGVLFVVFIISFFLLFLSVFTVLFNIIAAPFNGLLAEKAQQLLYGSTIPSISFTSMVFRTIKRQGQFIAYFLPRFCVMCILFFIPFLHPIYPFLWFFFNAWMLSFQYQDFVMDNNLIGFDEMKHIIKRNKLRSLGFGSLINLASFIPILNFFTMPAAVIGSVTIYCENNGYRA